MRESSRMTSKIIWEFSTMLMEIGTKDSFEMGKETEREFCTNLMVEHRKGSTGIICFMGRSFVKTSAGQRKENIKMEEG